MHREAWPHPRWHVPLVATSKRRIPPRAMPNYITAPGTFCGSSGRRPTRWFGKAVIKTVRAVDEQSANELATRQIDTTRSILAVMDSRPRPPRPESLTRRPDGTVVHAYRGQIFWDTSQGTTPDGRVRQM